MTKNFGERGATFFIKRVDETIVNEKIRSRIIWF